MNYVIQTKLDSAFHNISKTLSDTQLSEVTEKLCELGISIKNDDDSYKTTYEILQELITVMQSEPQKG